MAKRPTTSDPGFEVETGPPIQYATAVQREAVAYLFRLYWHAYTRKERAKALLSLHRHPAERVQAFLNKAVEMAEAWAENPAAYWQARHEKDGSKPDSGGLTTFYTTTLIP